MMSSCLAWSLTLSAVLENRPVCRDLTRLLQAVIWWKGYLWSQTPTLMVSGHNTKKLWSCLLPCLQSFSPETVLV